MIFPKETDLGTMFQRIQSCIWKIHSNRLIMMHLQILSCNNCFIGNTNHIFLLCCSINGELFKPLCVLETFSIFWTCQNLICTQSLIRTLYPKGSLYNESIDVINVSSVADNQADIIVPSFKLLFCSIDQQSKVFSFFYFRLHFCF
jgi:hypothetical protein